LSAPGTSWNSWLFRIAGVLAFALVVVVVVVVFGSRPRPPTTADVPRSDEDVVVQTWWRKTSAGAHVTGCRATGVHDSLTGAEVWACDLWYVDPDDRSTVCVALEERQVERRIRARHLPSGVSCA
jgi:hypothetical protein